MRAIRTEPVGLLATLQERVGAQARPAIAISLFLLAACGPIDAPAGHIEDRASGPSVVISKESPVARFTFTVTMNEEARRYSGQPSFLVESQDLELGNIEGPALAVDVTVRSSGGTNAPVEIRRGSCRGNHCVGTFTIKFKRTEAATGSVSFDWAIAANVNFATSEVPEGAAIDVVVA
jgi:hypothetical protein